MATRLKTLKPRLQTIKTDRVATLPGGDSWRRGKTTTSRGYGYAWQQARLRFLRQHPLCEMCEAKRRITAAVIVDHRIPHRGDQALFWDESNWQALCKPHHDSDKQAAEKSGRVKVAIGLDGWPVEG